MKQTMITLMALLTLLVGTAHAQNTLSVEGITVPQGGQAKMTIKFQFEQQDQYSGFQFDLALPSGLSLLKNNSKIVYEKGDCYEDTHQITANYVEAEDVYAFGCLSLESDPLIGTEGTLLTLTIEASASMEVGTILKGAIRKVALGTVLAQSVPLEDVEFSVTIGEPDDGRLKFYETSATLPSYIAGEKADVTMHRTIKANQWSTIVLPFTLTKAKAEAAFGSDVQLAEFNGFEVEYENEDDITPDAITINLSQYTMSAKKGMTGGKPLFIKTSKNIETIEADDVTLANTVTDVQKTAEYDTTGKLTGTLIKTTIPEDGLFISSNKFWYSVGKTQTKAFRCWLELGAVLDKETDFGARVALRFSEETSGISNVERSVLNGQHYYDLQGRRVEKPLRKGLYIKNGKKKIVK